MTPISTPSGDPGGVRFGSWPVKRSVSMRCPSDTRKPTLSEVGPGLQLRHCVLSQLDACPCASGTRARLQICSLIIFPRGSVRSADASALLSGRHLGVAREVLNSPRASAAPRPRWRRSGWTVAALQKGDKDASPAELGVAVKPTLKGRLATVHLSAAVRQRALETGPPG